MMVEIHFEMIKTECVPNLALQIKVSGSVPQFSVCVESATSLKGGRRKTSGGSSALRHREVLHLLGGLFRQDLGLLLGAGAGRVGRAVRVVPVAED